MFLVMKEIYLMMEKLNITQFIYSRLFNVNKIQK